MVVAVDGQEGRNSSASLRKALTLLRVVSELSDNAEGLALNELSQASGLNKSTVLRLAAPLLEENLLDRDHESGRFRLGHGCLQLGQSYVDSLDLRSAANAELRLLMRSVHSTCHLVVLSGEDVVYLDKVEDEATVRMASRVGATMPAYCTAVGKAMLAYSREDVVAPILAKTLHPITPRTITDPEVLRAELAAVRRRGYAIDDRENEPDVRCVAAPIFGHEDTVVAALSVSALSSRMTPRRVREVGQMAVETSLRISAKLGSRRARGRLTAPL
ncbi:IclR family transcriptional regulator [Arthrobacter sp. zg-Y20]|uniref:IclR family transcriptional regulator n=1 Tax=unclassified Arthrobacter TaxID=235627 RepID=UPI001D15D5CE|nr:MULTISPECIES: IclR family transcriptional regulator [unclassified Arthrobacter]MCC3275835.1 IclR family transcriptional regulator [Arthrobacter sp. zg-Y20]MDK1315992.1 IclR family transcriptional regulator [Arthrobacter sp. zg.Y20]WIB06232.1 IclR family transcriptional regulator [Arthrobacter sp. zg-Y20]